MNRPPIGEWSHRIYFLNYDEHLILLNSEVDDHRVRYRDVKEKIEVLEMSSKFAKFQGRITKAVNNAS